MSRVMGGALRRARCGRLASQALALLVVMAGFAFVTAPAAQAASLTLGKEAPASELAGANITYELTATNPNVAGAAPEYNITFRDELPVGVAYVPGSTTESYFGEPTIITAADGHGGDRHGRCHRRPARCRSSSNVIDGRLGRGGSEFAPCGARSGRLAG